ncbi:MAG TPA: FAD:protein FMN transferase [Candidatus Limnocylindrales bacterium]
MTTLADPAALECSSASAASASATSASALDARRPMMGGEVAIWSTGATREALHGVLDRIAAWAARLTRFDPMSELMRCNADLAVRVPIGPTLTAVLDWARAADSLTDGFVNITLLDARLAAEAGQSTRPPGAASRRWSLARGPRRSFAVREPGVRFDLDGVAKGWLADRALAITPGLGALVDADGDVAVRLGPGVSWGIGIADPRENGALLGALQFVGEEGSRRLGVATSGTTVHRWTHANGDAHHLIDPHTLRPAVTDIVQATVVAGSAREAEAIAKAAVIAGARRAFDFVDRRGVVGILVLTERGEVRASAGLVPWLA